MIPAAILGLLPMWALIAFVLIYALGGGKGIGSILMWLVIIGIIGWAVINLGSTTALLIGIGLFILWILFRK